MPNIQEISSKKKAFTKKEYRAWNFSSNSNSSKIKNTTASSPNVPNGRMPEISAGNIISGSSTAQTPEPLIKRAVDSLAAREQPVSNPLAAREQPVSNPLATREQPVSNPLATREQPVSNPLAAREQPVSNPLANPLANNLAPIKIPPYGKELETLLFLFENCVINCSLQTTPIATTELAQHLQINSTRLRNIVARIKRKGFVTVVCHNSGSNNAHRIFAFPKPVYDELLSIKAKNNPRIEANPLANPLATNDVVSSSNFFNTTTNIPEEFKDIDFSSLKNFGFSKSHLIQIYKAYKKNPENMLDANIIQDSINALAFDLEYNNISKDLKKDPIVVLVSLLKQGQPYSCSTPGSYLSPKDQAMKKYIEMKEQERHEKEKMAEKIQLIEFEKWFANLSKFEVSNILGGKSNSIIGSALMREKTKRAMLLEHYTQEVWPGIKNEKMKQFDEIQ